MWHKIHKGRAKVQSSRRFVVSSSGTLDQSWSPRSAARHDPSSAALPTMPVLASSHQPFNCSCPLMPHTWTVVFSMLYVCCHRTCSWKRNDARFRSFWGCPSCVGRGGVYLNVLISKSIVERHIAAAPRPGLGADPAYLFIFRRIPSSGWQL